MSPELNTELVKNRMYIDGNWVDAESGKAITVTNPADGSVIGTVPRAGVAETRQAVSSAADAYEDWRRRSAPPATL